MELYKEGLDNNYSKEDIDALVELCYYDEISRMSSDQIKEFCESEQAQALVERAVLRKPTLFRLSKIDDEKRRMRMYCYYLARQANDPEWKKCKKYRKAWKESRAKIFKKYMNKAAKMARISQKEYIKSASKQKATPEQKKAESAK